MTATPLKGTEPRPPQPSQHPLAASSWCPAAAWAEPPHSPTQGFLGKRLLQKKESSLGGGGGSWGVPSLVALGTHPGPARLCLPQAARCGSVGDSPHRTAVMPLCHLPDPPASVSGEWGSPVPGTCFQPWGLQTGNFPPFDGNPAATAAPFPLAPMGEWCLGGHSRVVPK